MPLLDFFRPPLSRTHTWRTFHGAWAAAIARQLNQGGLPAGYYALPFVGRAGPIEIDVATLHRSEGGVAPVGPSAWSPEAPEMTVVIDPPAVETARVDVLSDDGDPQLAAAIELASPSNKDRPATRQAFAAKCAGYLQDGSGLVVVDAVTNRGGDLHAAILSALGAAETEAGPSGLSAVAYRPAFYRNRAEVQLWPAALAVGRPLPTLPLWIAPDLSVPLNLEVSYASACADVAIRPTG